MIIVAKLSSNITSYYIRNNYGYYTIHAIPAYYSASKLHFKTLQ